MTLAPLAVLADLTALGVDITPDNQSLAELMLAVASAAVRDAAGSAISEQTSTITIEGIPERRLVLPAQPVTDVSAVNIDGEPVADWVLTSGSLWRSGGWSGRCGGKPSQVEVTFTHGFAPVPEDIVNLVCMFAVAGMTEAAEGSRSGLAYESIDDYRVGYLQGSESMASAMEVPQRTARMLRLRFGGGAYVTRELS